jgi:hypothetical protein
VRRTWLVLAVGAALALAGLGVAWMWWPDGRSKEPISAVAPDPRLTFPTPFRNVRPGVKYVGDKVCAECHADLSKSLRQHPMGQALAPVATATPVERYGADAFNPFVASGLHYRIQRRDNRSIHREWAAGPDGKVVAEIEVEVQYAMGSGARARSYLVNRDGYLFQAAPTWYPHGGRWDLSPGYEVRNQHFTRTITPACLFCHCNYAEHVPDTVNRYQQPIFQGYAIGCERCHGPGELHVANPQKVNGVDYSIVNPRHLEHPLREAVCQQCHLQGEQRILGRGRSDFDYRPGLPLHLFVMDFMNKNDQNADFKFVNSVEQMTVSGCYKASREPKKLGCISCHDPHRHPPKEEKVAHYRKRCLQCHTETSCRLPLPTRHEKDKQDSCIACHMPRTGSEVNHTSITDHRVRRHADEPARGAPARAPTPGPSDLVPFHRDLLDPQDEEVSRNLGLAVMAMFDRRPPDAAARKYAEAALPLLEQALKRDENDWAVREALGDALWLFKRHGEAMAAFERILAAKSGKSEPELTLFRAGRLALDMNRPKTARSYLERAVRVNPWRWQYHQGLAVASFRLGEWDRAVRECLESLRLEPFGSASRSLLVQCYLSLGARDKALAEYQTLRQLTPENRRAQLQEWFERLPQLVPPPGNRKSP